VDELVLPVPVPFEDRTVVLVQATVDLDCQARGDERDVDEVALPSDEHGIVRRPAAHPVRVQEVMSSPFRGGPGLVAGLDQQPAPGHVPDPSLVVLQREPEVADPRRPRAEHGVDRVASERIGEVDGRERGPHDPQSSRLDDVLGRDASLAEAVARRPRSMPAPGHVDVVDSEAGPERQPGCSGNSDQCVRLPGGDGSHPGGEVVGVSSAHVRPWQHPHHLTVAMGSFECASALGVQRCSVEDRSADDEEVTCSHTTAMGRSDRVSSGELGPVDAQAGSLWTSQGTGFGRLDLRGEPSAGRIAIWTAETRSRPTGSEHAPRDAPARNLRFLLDSRIVS
jgi:hypothetical protein